MSDFFRVNFSRGTFPGETFPGETFPGDFFQGIVKCAYQFLAPVMVRIGELWPKPPRHDDGDPLAGAREGGG